MEGRGPPPVTQRGTTLPQAEGACGQARGSKMAAEAGPLLALPDPRVTPPVDIMPCAEMRHGFSDRRT